MVRGEGLRIYQLTAESQMRAEAVVASGSDAGVAWHNPAMLATLGKGDVSFNFDNLISGLAWVDLTIDSEKKGGGLIRNGGHPPI